MRNAASSSAVLAILLLIQCVAFATPDPATVSTYATQYATALGNSRKLFRDAYGKYICVHKGSDEHVMVDYCNNDPSTPSEWDVNNLGANFLVDSGEEFGVAAAYNPSIDKLMVAFTQSGYFKAAQISFCRHSNNRGHQ